MGCAGASSHQASWVAWSCLLKSNSAGPATEGVQTCRLAPSSRVRRERRPPAGGQNRTGNDEQRTGRPEQAADGSRGGRAEARFHGEVCFGQVSVPDRDFVVSRPPARGEERPGRVPAAGRAQVQEVAELTASSSDLRICGKSRASWFGATQGDAGNTESQCPARGREPAARRVGREKSFHHVFGTNRCSDGMRRGTEGTKLHGRRAG